MSKKTLIILICVLAVALVGELIFVGVLNNREDADQQTQPGTTLPNEGSPAPGLNQEGADSAEDSADDPTNDPATDPSGDAAGDPTTEPSVDPSTDPSGDPSEPSDDPTTDPSGDPSIDPSEP